MNTGLDPELLTLNDGYIVPASYFLDAPERDTDGALPSISFDNAAVEIRPEHSDDLGMDTLALAMFAVARREESPTVLMPWEWDHPRESVEHQM